MRRRERFRRDHRQRSRRRERPRRPLRRGWSHSCAEAPTCARPRALRGMRRALRLDRCQVRVKRLAVAEIFFPSGVSRSVREKRGQLWEERTRGRRLCASRVLRRLGVIANRAKSGASSRTPRGFGRARRVDVARRLPPLRWTSPRGGTGVRASGGGGGGGAASRPWVRVAGPARRVFVFVIVFASHRVASCFCEISFGSLFQTVRRRPASSPPSLTPPRPPSLPSPPSFSLARVSCSPPWRP